MIQGEAAKVGVTGADQNRSAGAPRVSMSRHQVG